MLAPFATEPRRESFVDSYARVNQWRGRCVDALTRAEDAVTNCLVVLAEVPDRGMDVALPHLLGQRYEALARAIGPQGPFAAEGKNAFPALEAFKSHGDFRCDLCHGVGRISLDRNDGWVLVLRTTSLRSNKVVRGVLVVEEAEAQIIADDISRESHDLCAKLGILCKAFK
jgi:hypothetical protein